MWIVGRGVRLEERKVVVVTQVSWYKVEMLLVWARRLTCWAEARLGYMGTST